MASPNLRRRGVAPLAFSSLRCPGATLQDQSSHPLQIVSHTSCPGSHPPAQAWHSATTRDRALLTWGTCWVLPPFRRGREQPSLSRSGWEAPAWCSRGAVQPMGTEEVGRLAAVTLPGTGARRSGARRLTPRPGTEGEEPKQEEESQIRHRRTTAHQGYRGAAGPTPASLHPRPPA